MQNKSKGSLFAIDSLCALIMAFILIIAGFNYFSAKYSLLKNNLEQTELEGIALNTAEILVKARNTANPVNGSAEFDFEKKRNLENKIDSLLITGMPVDGRLNNDFFIKEITFLEKGAEKEILFESQEKEKYCITIERFVLFQQKKTLLGVKVCKKDFILH